jgi:hypothetical protein
MIRRIIEVGIGVLLLIFAIVGAVIFQQQYRNGVEFHAMPVPKADIPPYTILTEDMFVQQDFPQALFQLGGYASSADQLSGKIATSRIPSGLPIPLALVSTASDFRLADPKLEVVSIPITPPSSLGGHIRIGDKVNLYRLILPGRALEAQSSDALGDATVTLIAGDVPVVEVLGQEGGSAGVQSNGQTISAQILIVAVSPSTAQEILKLIAETKANALLWVTLATVK